MKIKIRLTEKPKRYTPMGARSVRKNKTQSVLKKGLWLDDKWFSIKRILRDKWLTKAEKDILLDMSGFSVKRVKNTRLNQKTYPIAKYYIDGVLYCDGSVDEISEFYGLS